MGQRLVLLHLTQVHIPVRLHIIYVDVAAAPHFVIIINVVVVIVDVVAVAPLNLG